MMKLTYRATHNSTPRRKIYISMSEKIEIWFREKEAAGNQNGYSSGSKRIKTFRSSTAHTAR